MHTCICRFIPVWKL